MKYRLLVAFNCAVNVRLPGCFRPLEVMYKTGHPRGHALQFHIGTSDGDGRVQLISFAFGSPASLL
jgi:hypothetical protein